MNTEPENILFRRMFPSFRPSEFECPCKHPLCQVDGMEFWFLAALQDVRLQVGHPFHIGSGYRCSAYNATLPNSVPDSYHIKGIAADIDTRRLNGQEKHRLLRKVFQRFTGVGIYPTFIHVDLRPLSEKVVWLG